MAKPWPRVRLEQLLQQRKQFILIDDTEVYKRCRVQLHARGIVLRDLVSGAEIKTKNQQVCFAGDFLVAEIDAKVGGFGIVPVELEGALVSSHYFLYKINESLLDKRFLNYFIRTAEFQEQVISQGSTNYAAIRPTDVMIYKIPLPGLVEQQSIVSRVEALAARVEEARGLRREAIEAVDGFVSSFHLSMAGGRYVNLDEVLTLDEQKEPIRVGQSYPQVGVKGFGQGLFAKDALDGTQTTYRTFNRLYDGAVVLSQVKGWEGAVGVCKPEFAGRFVSPEYRTFRCINGRVLPEYLSALLATQWFWRQLKNLTRGVGGRRERIRPEFFLQMKVPMPSIEAQQKACQMFRELTHLKRLQAETASELDALLPSVLDKAFRGEL
jgi:type I restriction enzyme S subunit